MTNTIKVRRIRIDKALKRKNLASNIWRHKALYLFIAPALIWFAIFCYIPMFGGILLIFKDYSFSKGILGSDFTNPVTKYLSIFFELPTLPTMIKNTIVIALFRLLLFPAPIILALMLNEAKNPRFKKIIQTITYFPFFISWVIIISMLEQLLTPYGSGGPLYLLLQKLSGNTTTTYYLIDEPYFYPLVIVTFLWKTVGWNSIIYLAALSNINQDVVEAARMDGVSRIRMIWDIYIPTIKPIIGLLFIQSLGSILSAGFEQIYFLQSPANLDVSNVLDVYVVKFGIEQGNYSVAAIAGLFQGLVGLFFIIVANSILKRTSDISLW